MKGTLKKGLFFVFIIIAMLGTKSHPGLPLPVRLLKALLHNTGYLSCWKLPGTSSGHPWHLQIPYFFSLFHYNNSDAGNQIICECRGGQKSDR